MPLAEFSELPAEDLRCPCRMGASLVRSESGVRCTDSRCTFSDQPFPQVGRRPALIPFGREETLFRVEDYRDARDPDLFVTRREGGMAQRLRTMVYGRSPRTRANFARLVALLPTGAHVLVIGSGTRGSGSDALWQADVELVGIDVYPSATVTLIADGHFLPFADGRFDAVVIQAVLEHVLEPHRVVAEIERVLKTDGFVYAETPFMQQVHEGAYDFQRFSVSGHRWLFRRFREVASGPNRGPAIGFCWALKYLVWGLLRSRVAGTLVYAAAYPLARLLDALTPERFRVDGPSGVYFLGCKEEGYALPPERLLSFYQGAQQR